MTIRYCSRCLNVSTRPGSDFSEGNVCFPCFYKHSAPTRSKVDQDLKKLVEFGRANRSHG